MINSSKSTQKFKPIAGLLPNDSGIEFFSPDETPQVLWMQNGANHYFSDLPQEYYNLVKAHYYKYPKAVAFISSLTDDERKQVEIYTYYIWGALDSTPDIKDGVLSEPENFRSKRDCPSLLWNCKNITLNGTPLTTREIFITDMMHDNVPDKTIASLIGVAHSTFDAIKRKLFKKADVTTKPAYVLEALIQKVILL